MECLSKSRVRALIRLINWGIINGSAQTVCCCWFTRTEPKCESSVLAIFGHFHIIRPIPQSSPAGPVNEKNSKMARIIPNGPQDHPEKDNYIM